jgi:glutamate synthase domain-containing protein 3
MTNGTVVVLGRTGRNFGAGMSGGIAYVFDRKGEFARVRCNQAGVDLEPLFEREDLVRLENLVRKHVHYTGSALGKRLLENWSSSLEQFVKVFPHEYKRILKSRPAVEKPAAEKKDVLLAGVQTHAVAIGEHAR